MKPRFLLLTFMLAALLLYAVLPSVMAQQTRPLRSVDQMQSGRWTMLTPGGETKCGRGTPYHFFVRPAENSDKLMIYFQGGGACWNSFSCQVGGTFDDFVNSPSIEVGYYDGVFNYANAQNPIADYNVVFVPYCTADVHVGDATVNYGDFDIYHNGFKNASAVLDWTFTNFTAPQNIIVTGSSAGSYGAIYHLPFVANQYPDAKIVQFGDAGVGVTPVGWEVNEQWGMFNNLPEFVPATADFAPETFVFNQMYHTYADFYPDVTFSQYTSVADTVQVQFYSFMNSATPWVDGMYANLSDLESNHANFRSIVVGGDSHTILASPQFYTFSTAGVLVRDWFAGLVTGEPVENLRCATCQ